MDDETIVQDLGAMFANLGNSYTREAIVANKILLFLVLAAHCVTCGGLSAQEELIAPLQTEFDDPPPQLELPEMPSDLESPSSNANNDLPTPIEGSEDGSIDPFADPLSPDDLQGSVEPFVSGEEEQFVFCEPALLESSGTWLRRGFWYTEFDVVISDRIWRRDTLILIGQQVGAGANTLTINGGQNHAEAAPRLKLGRFLFRDYKNRDHAFEFVTYGGGEWSQHGRLDANPNNVDGSTALTLPTFITRGNDSFTDATSSQYQYDSRLNSFELNYKVSMRMQRDRMELEPNGSWVRRAQPSVSWALTAGLRYIDISEDLDWDAFGIPDADNDTELENGTYDILTDNDMIGTQLGFSWTHERARWSLGAHAKGGIMLNHSEIRSAFEVTGNVTSGSNRIDDDNISFLTDVGVTAKWHLRPNVSLRVGLDLIFLTSLSLAPDQINFAPLSTSENIVAGDVTFLGGSLGLETYW